MKRNPYQSFKTRPLKFSEYNRREILDALHVIHSEATLTVTGRLFDDGIEIAYAIERQAKQVRERIVSRFECGELAGLA